jgi:hypothetical protein
MIHLTRFDRGRKPHSIQPPTMPPKARQNSRNSIEKEGRIILAISALNKQEISSIRKAARIFNISHATLCR